MIQTKCQIMLKWPGQNAKTNWDGQNARWQQKKSGQNANKSFGILSVGSLSVGILSAHHNIIIINSLFQHFGFLKVRKVPITPYPSGAGAPVEWPFLSHETLLSTETGAFQQNLLNDKRTMNSIMQHRSERKYLLAQQCYSSQLNRLHFGSSLGCFVQRGSTWVKKAFFFQHNFCSNICMLVVMKGLSIILYFLITLYTDGQMGEGPRSEHESISHASASRSRSRASKVVRGAVLPTFMSGRLRKWPLLRPRPVFRGDAASGRP